MGCFISSLNSRPIIKMHSFLNDRLRIYYLLLFLNSCLLDFSLAESYDTTLNKISLNKRFIEQASESFCINYAYLSAIIFVERTLNYTWRDDSFDIILAKTGRNSSIGFCQIKIKTAYWIECQFNDASSLYFPGVEYQNLITISKSVDELLSKLKNDSLNIIYAAAYSRIILSRWRKDGFPIDRSPDIIGTLYSTGMYNSDGTERKPNGKPNTNYFGEKVKDALKYFR